MDNIAVNSPVQTFEALVMYKGLKNIYENMKKYNIKSKFMTMVHDSVVFYSPKDELKTMYNILKESMEDHTTWEIPILIDISVGKVWGFGEEISDINAIDKYLLN
jgi:DNA polymerase-1